MITVNFIFRKKDKYAHSIEKLFHVIINNIPKDKFNKNIVVNPYDFTIIGIIKSILFFRKYNNSINHITGDIHWLAIFLNSKTTILTIHDLVGYYKYTGIRKFIYYLFWIYLPIKKSRYITVISEKTKNEILSILPWAESKIVVIPNCLTMKALEEKKPLKKDNLTILIIGALPNKNIERTIIAAKDLPIRLEIVGILTKEQQSLLAENNINYNQSYNISEEKLTNLYKEADILSFPSLYEGFGLPILEAQANDMVVITSNISPMKDVAGDAALFVNPYNTNEIRNAIINCIENQEMRKNLIEKGRRNIQKYSVENIVADYIKLYNNIKTSNI